MRHDNPILRQSLLPGILSICLCWGVPALAQNSAAGEQHVKSRSAETCTNPSPDHASPRGMVVGFSQSENEQNPFRAAETASVKEAAAKVGAKLLYTNANDNQAKQVSDIESMINQGAKALIVAPLNSTGLQPAFAQAEAKRIPVVTIDRLSAGTFCHDFITNMGSDFYAQGENAAKLLNQVTGGKAEIIELQGAYGNNVVTERTNGFADELKKHSGMHILAAQTANWSTTEAQRVMEQLLLAHPNVNAVYTQSDTMAYGAIQALSQAGKSPGSDVKVVSIDGTKQLVQDIANGTANADVETNPRFGPASFAALEDWFNGKPVAQKIVMADHEYTKANAAQALKEGMPY